MVASGVRRGAPERSPGRRSPGSGRIWDREHERRLWMGSSRSSPSASREMLAWSLRTKGLRAKGRSRRCVFLTSGRRSPPPDSHAPGHLCSIGAFTRQISDPLVLLGIPILSLSLCNCVPPSAAGNHRGGPHVARGAGLGGSSPPRGYSPEL
jgi:hypothetical protein